MGLLDNIVKIFKSKVLLNEPITWIGNKEARPKTLNYASLWGWFKNSPELISMINSIIEDIMSDSHYFEGDAENIKEAEMFVLKTKLKQKLISMLTDAFVTGDGYLYIGRNSEMQIKALITKAFKNFEFKASDKITEQVMEELRPDLAKPTDIQYIPSSTVKIVADDYGQITKYIQTVGNNTKEYTPDEVLHFKLMDIDGKIYGFTPIQSILVEMDVLANIKNCALQHFVNGGTPNKMFILKNIQHGSPAYKRFVQALTDFKSLTNKFSNMVICSEGGEIDIKDLNPITKDMEYQSLAVYMTQVMVMLWGIPPSRLPNLGGKSSSATAETTGAEGYYRKISHNQDMLEDMLYTIFEKFKVVWKFGKTYKQDEVREVQVDMFKTDTLVKKQGILSKYDKKLTENAVLRMLGLDDADIEEGAIEPDLPMGGAFGAPKPGDRQGFEKNKNMLDDSPDKGAKDKTKQKAEAQKT